jgi:hypothetical protein
MPYTSVPHWDWNTPQESFRPISVLPFDDPSRTPLSTLNEVLDAQVASGDSVEADYLSYKDRLQTGKHRESNIMGVSKAVRLHK